MTEKVQISNKISREKKSLPVKKIIIAIVAIFAALILAYLFLQIPQARIESVIPNPVIEGDPIVFIGNGITDKLGGNITAYEWSLNNSILSNEKTYNTQNLSVGIHTIQFRVKDNYGKWSKPNISDIKVLFNNPPVARIDSIHPGTNVFNGTLMNFAGIGTDPDKNDSIAAYEWSINNSILNGKETFAIQNLLIGTHALYFRVRDNHGKWSVPATAVFTIYPYIMYNVFKEKGLIVLNGLCDNGDKNCMSQSNIFGPNILGGGYYGKVGERIALNGNASKLSDLIIEQGVSDKKTLAVGQIWNVGDGWTLTANAIDAKATPRQVWLTLKYNGTKVDDYILAQGQVYTYFESSIEGEHDVPLFVTYIDSIYAGATTDIVDLRFTWAISRNITIIK